MVTFQVGPDSALVESNDARELYVRISANSDTRFGK